ncbi:MAG TPA: TonB-dependent receptor plug domain-containing protein [Moraxellaceae bacterium]|nr:TonB-dependent receptor plug domain-containing protein [Moraxellaceae bacterium]
MGGSRNRLQSWPAAFLALAWLGAWAGDGRLAEERLLRMPLSDLLQLQVSTASIQPSSQREQPGALTVLTAEDMAAAGARTLQDALLLVPGVSFGLDVFNVPGLVFRGTWAYEGKILFLVDDLPVNDLLYGIYAIPPNFPVELLDRVEILRGPGGAKYGENAELAVIRIYTRNSSPHDGFAAVTTAAQRDGHPLGQVSAGQQWWGREGSLALLGTASTGSWGSGTWTDAAGARVDTSAQEQESAQLALASEWRGTRLQFYFEQFNLDAVQRYGFYQPDMAISFRHANLRLEHDFRLTPSTTLTPRWTWRDENTWQGTSALPSNYELPAQRHTLDLEARHNFSWGGVVRAGVQQYWAQVEAAQMQVPDAFPGNTPANYFDGRPDAEYRSFSAFAEGEVPLGDYLLSTGARYSNHSVSGDAVVPRVALTRAEPDWHVKALYESAYREPQFETINQRAGVLKPELTTVYEVEGGHRLGRSQYLTASLFDYELRDAIVFSVAPSGIPGYVNGQPFRGRGLELQWRLELDRLQLQANYQRSSTDDDAIPVYDVLGRNGQSLGAPRDVFNAWAGWQLSSAWSLHPRLRYQGERTALAYDAASAATPPLAQRRLDAELTVDLSTRYRRGPWSWELGLRNVADEEQWLPQPYTGLSPPYPVGGREWWSRLQYDF